ncbi:MAG TPA: FAD-dependent oxidoreductase [Pyrinomonadaceae bacterium]
MAKVLILGGGFGGVIAAQRLAEQLGDEHQITMVARSRNFVFYPALVRLAFGKCQREDVSFDLRHAMLDRRVNFIEAEVARIDPHERIVKIAHGEVEGKLPYDYVVYALGRRLATERISGFYEHAHHLLNVDKAIKFGKALANFHEGRAVIGQCPDARLPIPVYETAFALARRLEENNDRDRVRITIVSADSVGSEFGEADIGLRLQKALHQHQIEFISGFSVERITEHAVLTGTGQAINFDLLMLMPPFQGASAALYQGITNDAYINVDWSMRVVGVEGMYAVGDCVNFSGPKMGHMAVRQAEVAATNLAAEIEGHEPVTHYDHEMRLVIDEGGSESLYLHKDIWTNEPGSVRQGRFWSWAKRVQEKYWETSTF